MSGLQGLFCEPPLGERRDLNPQGLLIHSQASLPIPLQSPFGREGGVRTHGQHYLCAVTSFQGW